VKPKQAVPAEEIPYEVIEAGKKPENIFGKYILVQELGRGGMGIVYKAWQRDLGRFVVLKFHIETLAEDALHHFYREARTIARLSHPNIIQVYDVGVEKGRHYIARQFIDGVGLDKAALPLPRALEVIRDIALAMDHAHHRGIIHRDIKPQNIMIDNEGIPYIMDFDLARIVRSRVTIAAGHTVVGTPCYMSPEQAAGENRQVDERSDIYSLGTVLYEILTKVPPVEGDSTMAVLMSIIHKEPKPIRQINPEVPRELEAICMKALEKEKERRYQSMGAFAQDINNYLQGQPVLARPSTVLTRAWRYLRRKKRSAIVVTLAILVAIGAIVFGLFQREHKRMIQRRITTTQRRYTQAQLAFMKGSRALDKAQELLYFDDTSREDLLPHLDNAINSFLETLEKDPEYLEAYHQLGRAYEMKGFHMEAEHYYTLAIEKFERKQIPHIEAYLDRGKFYLRKCLRGALQFKPYPRLVLRGQKLWRQKAIDNLRVVQRHPENQIDSLFAQAIIHLLEGEYLTSITRFEDAIQKDPHRVEILQLMSLAYALSGNIEAAMYHIELAISHRAGDVMGYILRGIFYLAVEDKKKAWLDLEKALATDVTWRDTLIPFIDLTGVAGDY
jgi:tetratricopeptide (TPR) repeat protein/predicted Ser/Thr protein kinase